MPLVISLDELLRYSGAERGKWRQWFGSHPDAIDAPVQPEGRFPTVGKLVDHIFLVERRHLERLTGTPVSESTGLTGSNAAPLFDYGASVRRELEQFASELDADVAGEPRTFRIRDQDWTMTTRKLLFHIVLHEVRHWAQIALAVRLAGYHPPGEHDLVFSPAIR